MQYPNFVIERVKQSDILAKDKERYNSNNHWTNNALPVDYKEVINKSHTSNWISKFRSYYKTIIIDDMVELIWMKQVAQISEQTGKFSELYREELNDFLNKYSPMYQHLFDGTGYFVRSENVSFKYGQHGIGPYYSLKEIIESCVSCVKGHRPIYPDTTSITLYLLEWVNIKPYDEYRVFVSNNKISAISQQHLHNVYPELNNNQQIIQTLKNIYDYFESNIKHVITNTDSYTYDFAFVNDNLEPFFIEQNSFGKEYAAGSALYHWLIDENILYGKHENTIYFRYTVK
jgi:hypothetical protein